MRNKRLAAGSHLLPPHVTGAWSYGFYRHYPHGPYPTRHNSGCSVGEWCHGFRLATYTVQMQDHPSSLFSFPTGIEPGSAFLYLQPILAAAGLRPRQPRLSAAGDCGARLGDFKNLANMAPPLSVPKNGGSQRHVSTFPQIHKARKEVNQ